MRVPLLNFEGGPGVLLLNFEEVPWVPLLNFEGNPEVLGPRIPVPLLHHAIYQAFRFHFVYCKRLHVHGKSDHRKVFCKYARLYVRLILDKVFKDGLSKIF